MVNRKNLLTFVVFALNFAMNGGANNEGLIDHFSNSSTTHSQPMNFENNNNLLFLAELPLEQLLKVKKSIEELQQLNGPENNEIMTETTLESRAIDDDLNLPIAGKISKSDALPLPNHNNNNPQLTQPLINRLVTQCRELIIGDREK
jgi:hypothetical protein